jgi:hypothetical protein
MIVQDTLNGSLELFVMYFGGEIIMACDKTVGLAIGFEKNFIFLSGLI